MNDSTADRLTWTIESLARGQESLIASIEDMASSISSLAESMTVMSEKLVQTNSLNDNVLHAMSQEIDKLKEELGR